MSFTLGELWEQDDKQRVNTPSVLLTMTYNDLDLRALSALQYSYCGHSSSFVMLLSVLEVYSKVPNVLVLHLHLQFVSHLHLQVVSLTSAILTKQLHINTYILEQKRTLEPSRIPFPAEL